MAYVTGLTRAGETWVPAFIVDLNQKKCIACGRCFKACPRQVFNLMERSDAVEYETDDYDDESFSDESAMVMAIENSMDCIGCEACSRVCPKKCISHAPQSL